MPLAAPVRSSCGPACPSSHPAGLLGDARDSDQAEGDHRQAQRPQPRADRLGGGHVTGRRRPAARQRTLRPGAALSRSRAARGRPGTAPFHRAPITPPRMALITPSRDPSHRGEQVARRTSDSITASRWFSIVETCSPVKTDAQAAVRQLVEEVVVLVRRLVEAELGAEPCIGRGRPARADESSSVAGHERFQYERHRGDNHVERSRG